jgi:hypothetical protein
VRGIFWKAEHFYRHNNYPREKKCETNRIDSIIRSLVGAEPRTIKVS